MVRQQLFRGVFVIVFVFAVLARAEQAGGIRGIVRDKDFAAPLSEAQVSIAETQQSVTTAQEGNFLFDQMASGTYTLVFSKDGYVRQVRSDVVVSAGKMSELDISLSGEFTELEEYIVQDLQLGSGTEAGLLNLRMESPALMDSVSSELMSQAGASDAAGALKLVSGATVQDGKYAVVRGLPDRYVNSQMNGVRLPTADSDKRAVQLDQFPSAIIESVQVSKTFTPDQQGDASGGAVNIVLKGIPEERVLKLSGGTSWNTNVMDGDFLSYKDGGLGYWGGDDRSSASNIKAGGAFDRDAPAGVSESDAPTDNKWSAAFGDKKEYDDLKIGGFGSFFYDKSASFFDDGVDNKYWVGSQSNKIEPLTSPDITQRPDPTAETFNTSLYDVTQASEQVQWGGLGVLGIENEMNRLNLLYLNTQSAEDTTTLAEDTRGKQYYFPGYDMNNPTGPGNGDGRFAAPYLRAETLEYTERSTETVQLSGWHKLLEDDLTDGDILSLKSPELDWVVSRSSAQMNQPDKRQFGSMWFAPYENPGYPDWGIPPSTEPGAYRQLNAGSNISFGNYQRMWKDILEDSEQYSLNLKMPFEQWSGDEGYFKLGVFDDTVTRDYEQESLSNSGENVDGINAGWNESWSAVFPQTNADDLPGQPRIDTDVDYDGKQDITAWYYMMDVPVNSMFNIIGGTRFESTDLSIENSPDSYTDVTWIGMDSLGRPVEVQMTPDNKGDVSFSQTDVLPSIGFLLEPVDEIAFRGSYSETVARQTFKELSPILQQEYLGGDIFIGNPDLEMSALRNYDLRLDWKPYEATLLSTSYFWKDVTDPIEYVRRVAPTGGYDYTTAVNYPEGKIDGIEFEVRHKMNVFWDKLEGLSLGANATLLNSEVTLSDTDYDFLPDGHKFKTRDMVNTPEHLYNFFTTYDIPSTRTKLGLFYTIRGDALVSGAGQSNGNFIPNVYETEYGTLNFSLSQKLGDIWNLGFQVKNLLNPDIESVYRYNGDTTKTSYTKGLEISIGLSAEF